MENDEGDDQVPASPSLRSYQTENNPVISSDQDTRIPGSPDQRSPGAENYFDAEIGQLDVDDDIEVQRPKFLLHRGKRKECLPSHIVLYQAALQGDWDTAKIIIDDCSSIVRDGITAGKETALHIAAAAKQTNFVEKLVARMEVIDLALKNDDGNTALCYAAASGIVRIAEVMVKKNAELPTIRGNDKKVIPLAMAVSYRRKDMVSYLFKVTAFDSLTKDEQIGLLVSSISSDYYDVALKILEKNLDLAIERDEYTNETALHVLSRKPDWIGSSSQLSMWEKCSNWLKGTYNKAVMKTLAHQLTERLWKRVMQLNEGKISDLIREPSRLLFDDAKVGNVDFLIILIRSYPDLIWKLDDDKKSLFHVAVENRHDSLFNLIYEMGAIKDLIATYVDAKQHNMLHLAAKRAPQSQLNKISGAALQMQRELLWFEEVKSIVLPSYLEMKNKPESESDSGLTLRVLYNEENKELIKDGESWAFQMRNKSELGSGLSLRVVSSEEQKEVLKDGGNWILEMRNKPKYSSGGSTPHELFTKEHKELLKEGEKWMKGTANSCMLVATLIATVVFAAAFTVPGGTDDNTGTPTFLKMNLFTLFMISDAVGLISSSTSILMFLSILTSRYAERDFLVSLPVQLLTGLATLFISIVSMVLAFSITCFLIYDKTRSRVPLAIAVMAILPVGCFAWLHHRLWFDTFFLTYRSKFRIFNQNKRRLNWC